MATLGQYLKPTREHLPGERFVSPAEFDALREAGMAAGLRHVEAGPLVRSSYHAERHRPDPPDAAGALQVLPGH